MTAIPWCSWGNHIRAPESGCFSGWLYAACTPNINVASVVFLQVLPSPLIQTIESFLQILQRVRNAKPQVSFTELTECRPRERRDSTLLKQGVGKRLGFPSR